MCYICGAYSLAYGGAPSPIAASGGAAVAAATAATEVRDYTALTGASGGAGWNGQFGTGAGTPITVTYSFETSAYSYLAAEGYSSSYIASFQVLNSAERAKAVEALGLWDAASGISFVEVPAGLGDIRFAKYNFDFDPLTSWAAGYAYYPSFGITTGSGAWSWTDAKGGDVFLNTQEAASLGEVHLYAHELGHAIGFKHPFEDTPTLASDLDTVSQTVMSYTGAWGTTLGPIDLAAVRYLYGTTDHGNTSSWSWSAASLLLTQVGKTGADRIIGVSVRDHLSGGDGNDTLAAFGGADTVFGDGGIDQILGGAGNDSLDGGAGNDTVTGDEGNDTISGGTGDDSLLGDIGDDLFLSDAGADTIYGGSGFDVLSYANATAAIVINGRFQYGHAGAAAGDWIKFRSDIEKLVGSGFADVIRYGYFMMAEGGAGNDSLYGDEFLSSNETLDGGTGSDSMTGYGGNDTYYVDNAGDIVVEAQSGGTDSVFASAHYTLAVGQSIEILQAASTFATASLNLSGNQLAQTIVGNAGANVINGRGGADVLIGLGGNDIYYVDNVSVQVMEMAGGGVDTIRTTISNYVLSAGKPIEVIAIANAADLAVNSLTGNELAQSLIGSAGINILDGGGGADTMTGLGGNDIYYVDNAGDRVIEAVGGGSDCVRTTLLYTALTAGQAIETLQTVNSALTTTVQLVGNEFGQRIFGNAGNNVIDGRLGADQLTGYGGRDYFVFATRLEPANVDRIMDFTVGTDIIRLENAVFTAFSATGTLAADAFYIGAAAHDATDRILYNATAGTLSYDPDGNGVAAAIRFATLGTGLALKAADFQII